MREVDQDDLWAPWPTVDSSAITEPHVFDARAAARAWLEALRKNCGDRPDVR